VQSRYHRRVQEPVNVMPKDLDEDVELFRTRRLDAGPSSFVAADAVTMKIRESGRVLNVAAMFSTGVIADVDRDMPGIHCHRRTLAASLAFSAPCRSQPGEVALVTSDAHTGPVEAIAATFAPRQVRDVTGPAADLFLSDVEILTG
jgi:putative transposase